MKAAFYGFFHTAQRHLQGSALRTGILLALFLLAPGLSFAQSEAAVAIGTVSDEGNVVATGTVSGFGNVVVTGTVNGLGNVVATGTANDSGSVSAGSTGGTFGDVICSVANNLSPFLNVFDMIAYVMGAFFIIQGLLHLRNHHDNPAQHPHHKTFAQFGAGACLLALPSVIGTLVDTLFSGNVSGGNGLSYCSGGTTGGSGVSGLDIMLTNFINNINYPMQILVSTVAIALGVFLIIRGLAKAAKYGNDPRTHSITSILTNLIVGTVLVVVGQSVDVIMGSVFGGPSIMQYSSLSWSGLSGMGDTTGFQQAVGAALTFVQLVGFISFVRGWNVIRNAVEGSGQATVPQGLTHIIGGVLAININSFLKIADATLGTGLLS